MSAYDLREYIEKEFEENPILEADFNLIEPFPKLLKSKL